MSKPNFPIANSREEFEDGGKGVYTEIIINSPPATVRAKLLDFKNRSKWDPFVTAVDTFGNLDDISSKPKVQLTMCEKMDGGKSMKLPAKPDVYVNDTKSLIWGMNMGCLGKAEQGHVFIPLEDGTKTKLVHYEFVAGCLFNLMFNLKLLEKGYTASNECLKKMIEEEQSQANDA